MAIRRKARADLSGGDMSTPQVTVLSANSERAEIIAALLATNGEAKRAPAVVGTAAMPSRWDRMHGFLDGLLDLLDC